MLFSSVHFYSSFRTKYFQVQDTSGDNAIVGLGGNDQIFVNRRVDRICGGSGDEFLSSDSKLFGDGSDHLAGSPGDDNLNSIDVVVDDDKLYGGDYINGDSCQSEPDLETNCKIQVFHPPFFRRCRSSFPLLFAYGKKRRKKKKRKKKTSYATISFFLFPLLG
jgi:hypothetical protein